jgi:hypothetical protein
MLVLPAVSFSLAAFAQTTGVIAGHAYDQSGSPLRGIRVSVSSDIQIGGARTVTTDEEGAFQIPGLSPGRFTVTAAASKMKSVVMNNIRVTPGATTDVDIVMEVETSEEQVTVIEKAPLVNTGRANVGEAFDFDFVDQLPLSTRDFQGVAALTPGVTDSGSGNPSVRGGTFFNNSYQVDGFQTTDPVTHTFGQNFSFNAMASVEVQTAAYGAENASTTGGVTNIVTKSGSNRLEVDGTFTYTDQHLQMFKDARDRGSNHEASLNVSVGGPIIKDRLWFYFSGEGIAAAVSLPDDPSFPDHPPLSLLAFNGLMKLTWQVTPRNKLELKATFSPADFQNIEQSYLTEPEAETRQIQSTRFLGLQWHSVPSDNFYLVTRAGFQDIRLITEPQSCKWDSKFCNDIAPEIDLLTGILRQNATESRRDFRRSLELSGTLDWFKNSRTFGNHAVKLGARFQAHYNPTAETVPGDAIHYVLDREPYALSQSCANDPKESKGECRSGWIRTVITGREGHLFLQDAWKPTRHLTITPGVALHYARSLDDKERVVTNILAPTPHLQVSWDPTHDGRTVIRGSFSNYVDTGFLALARFTSRSLYSNTCFWDEDAQAFVGNCRRSGGNGATTVGLPCGPNGLNPDGSSCKTELRTPRTWEYTVGAEREIVTGITLGTDLIYRKFVHQWEDLETNAIWNQGGTGLRREGNWKSGRAEFIFDLETPDEARRRYVGLTTSLRKREGLLKVIASYTWSKYDGTEDNSYASTFLDNPGQSPYFYGPLPVDYRHDVRLQATYMFRPWLSAGVVYDFLSGGPYNRFIYDSEYQSFNAFGTRRGYDTRGTINPDDDSPLRLPDLSSLDLQGRVSLNKWLGQKVDVFVDVLNIMALRTTVSVIQQDGPFWGRPSRRMPATRARFGLRYRF